LLLINLTTLDFYDGLSKAPKPSKESKVTLGPKWKVMAFQETLKLLLRWNGTFFSPTSLECLNHLTRIKLLRTNCPKTRDLKRLTPAPKVATKSI